MLKDFSFLNLMSGLLCLSSAFSRPSLCCWRFLADFVIGFIVRHLNITVSLASAR